MLQIQTYSARFFVIHPRTSIVESIFSCCTAVPSLYQEFKILNCCLDGFVQILRHPCIFQSSIALSAKDGTVQSYELSLPKEASTYAYCDQEEYTQNGRHGNRIDKWNVCLSRINCNKRSQSYITPDPTSPDCLVQFARKFSARQSLFCKRKSNSARQQWLQTILKFLFKRKNMQIYNVM